MKKQIRMMLVLMIALGFYSVPVFAHGTKPELLSHAVAETLETFESDEKGTTIKAFLGVKGWFEKSTAKVKVYLTENRELRYSCEEKESADEEKIEFVCKKDAE